MRRRSDKAFSERRRRRNKRQYLIPLICAAAFLVVGTLLYALIFGFGASAESFYPLAVTPETDVEVNGENVYYLSGSTLNCADKKGAELWRVKLTSGAVNLSVSDTQICVYSSDMATVLTAQGDHIYTLSTTDYKTKSVRCGGEYTALLSQTQDAQYLRVFNSEGAEIYRCEYPAEEILDYGFYGSNDLLFVLTLDTTGTSPISRVTTISPATQALTGTVDIADQLISDVDFHDTDMLLCGTSTLAVYDNFGKQTDSSSIHGLMRADSSVGEGGYVYAFLPKDVSELTSSSTVRIIGSTGGTELDTNIQLPSGMKGVYVSQNKLYCVMADSVFIYKLSGEFERTLDAPAQIESVHKLGEDKLEICCKDRVYILIMD